MDDKDMTEVMPGGTQAAGGPDGGVQENDELDAAGLLKDELEGDEEIVDEAPFAPPLPEVAEEEYGDPADLYDDDDYADIPENGVDEVMVVYSEWEPGEVITGRYEVREKLEGGSGPVYIVYHRAWRCLLVAKTPGPEMLEDMDAARRLTSGVELWSELGPHPNIATCYYVQMVRGFPLVFIDHVDGQGLHSLMKEWGIPAWDTVLDMAIQFCEGMARAHSRGLVHGNIKPSNCIVAEDGALKVTDFGMMKPLDGGPGLRDAAAMYAAPEVWDSIENATPASDMYSFGALLYEMCCGKAPYEAGDGLAAKVKAAMPQAPSELRGDIPSDLSAFILKCLGGDPAGRPAGFSEARDFLRDVYNRVVGTDYPRPAAETLVSRADEMNDRGVSLHDLGLLDDAFEMFSEAHRINRDHLAAIFNLGWMEIEKKKTSFIDVKRRLEEAMAEAGPSVYGDQLLAELALKSGNLKEAERLLELAGDAPGATEKLGLVLASMGKWARAAEMIRASMGPSPEEEKVVALGKCLLELRVGLDDLPGVFENLHPRFVQEKFEETRLPWIRLEKTFSGHEGRVKSMCITAGGVFLISGGGDKTVRVWDAAGGECLRVFRDIDAECLAADPAGKFFLSGTYGGAVSKYDLESKKLICRLDGHEAWVTSVALDRSARIAVTGSADKTIRIWNHANGQCMNVLREHDGGVRCVAISPDGKSIISGSDDCTAVIWESATGRPVQYLQAHEKPVWHVSVTRDGEFVITISEDGVLCIWDLETAQLIRTHRNLDIVTAAVYPGGQYLVTGSADSTVGIWDLNENQRIRILEGHTDFVSCVSVSERGGFIISGSNDGTLKKWNIKDIGRLEYVRFIPQLGPRLDVGDIMARRSEFEGRRRRAELLMEASDFRGAANEIDEAAAVRGYERDPALRDLRRKFAYAFEAEDLADSWLMHALVPQGSHVLCVGVSPDGATAVSGTRDNTVEVWDVAAGVKTKTLSGHGGFVNHVKVSDDGATAVSSSADGTLRVWDLAAGEILQTLDCGGKRITALALTPGGGYAVTGNREGEVVLFDLDGKTPGLTPGGVLSGHDGEVTCAAVSPDGTFFVTGGKDKTLRVWQLPSGRCVKVLEGHEDAVRCAAVSPDGNYIISGAGGFSHADTTLKIWSAASGECAQTLAGHEAEVTSVALTPCGRFAVSAGFDKTLRIWELATGRSAATIDAHADEIQDMSLSADAMTAITCSWGDTLTAWSLTWDYNTTRPLGK